MSEEASLTGSLSDGAPQAVQRYNAILRHFAEQGQVPAGLFEYLPEGTSFGKLGVEARMLSAFFEGDPESKKQKAKSDASVLIRLAPFVDSSDLAELVKEYVQDGVAMDSWVLTALAPFLKSSDLGELIRKRTKRPDEKPEAPAQPRKPNEPAGPAAPTPAAPVASTMIERAPDRSPARPSLEDLSAQLRRDDLTQEERQAIAIQLAEIAHEQARFGA